MSCSCACPPQADPQGVAATADNGVDGGHGAGAEDIVEWGVYLRTAEDQKRTKVEWEKEHKEWIEDQVRGCVVVLCGMRRFGVASIL